MTTTVHQHCQVCDAELAHKHAVPATCSDRCHYLKLKGYTHSPGDCSEHVKEFDAQMDEQELATLERIDGIFAAIRAAR